MAEEFLDCPDIVPILEKMRSERVTKGVTRRSLLQPSHARSLLHCSLEHRLVQMVTPALSRFAVTIDSRGRETPLPDPLSRRAWVLLTKCAR